MDQVRLSSENIDVIRLAVEQANSRLKDIEQGRFLLPMQYSARLSWEVLYEAREILRRLKRPRTEQPRPPLGRWSLSISSEELLGLTQAIEQVMGKLQQIEMEQDMTAMKALALQCQQALAGCLCNAWNRRSALMVADW